MNHGATVRMKIEKENAKEPLKIKHAPKVTLGRSCRSLQFLTAPCLPPTVACKSSHEKQRIFLHHLTSGWATWLALLSRVRGKWGVSGPHISASSLTLLPSPWEEMPTVKRWGTWSGTSPDEQRGLISFLPRECNKDSLLPATEILALLVTEQYQQYSLTGAAKAGLCNKCHALCSFPNSAIYLIAQKWHMRWTFHGGT